MTGAVLAGVGVVLRAFAIFAVLRGCWDAGIWIGERIVP